MAGWFLFSSLLSTYNKFVFGKEHMAFPCPLLMTSVHFLAQWIFSATLCTAFPRTMGGERVTRMPWPDWAWLSIPCGIITSGDIGLSNLSVVTLSLTFYTMVKASTPVFVLGWAYLFGIEKITWPLLGVIAVIVAGEFLTVKGEVQFEWYGFALCLTASMLSGARWTLVQLKLQTMEPPLKTTIATMRLLAPSMFVSLFFVSLLIEKPWEKLSEHSSEYLVTALGLGLLGASLAILMILCEFYLIMHTSAVILMIGGVVKELITICLGVLVFKDQLNRVNVMGCFVVFLGVLLYKIIFHYEHKNKNRGRNRSGDQQSGNYEAVDGEDGPPTEDDIIMEQHEITSVEDPVSNGGGNGLELRRPLDELRKSVSRSSTSNSV
jgi:solute carrier family 35 protein C2